MPLGMGGYGPTGGMGQGFGPGGGNMIGQAQGQPGLQQQPQVLDPAAILSSPIDVPSMIAQKGYNPANFDTRPPFVSSSFDYIILSNLDSGSILCHQILY